MSCKIFIGKNPIEKYVIAADKDGWRAKNTAAYILIWHIRRLTGVTLRRVNGEAEYMIKLDEITEGAHPEYMRICSDEKCLYIAGGRRGIIYAAYEFLERFAEVKFYAPDCEVLPENKDIIIPAGIDFEVKTPQGFEYRDFFGKAASDEETRMRFRYNVNYSIVSLDPAHGGALSFAGRENHTLSGGYLLNKPEYKENHPEYFSLVNGKRLMDGSGQVCLTNAGALQAVIREVKNLVRANPGKRYVSVSEDDNTNSCQCPGCLEALKTMPFSDLFFTFINNVARETAKEFPDVLIHTFSYHNTYEPPSFPVEKNVAVQITAGAACKCHALDDADCPHNVKFAERLREWGKKCSYILIWDYNDNHQIYLLHQPNLLRYRRDIRFYAENNVRGVFEEIDHSFGSCFPCTPAFSELKAYVVSKLLWNPYMHEDEFQGYIDGFLKAYFGDGGIYIKEYLELWSKEAAANHVSAMSRGYDGERKLFAPGGASGLERMAVLDEQIRSGVRPIIPLNKTAAAASRALSLFDKAFEKAGTEIQRQRICTTRLHVLFYELFWTMEDIMQNGTRAQKAEVLRKNKELIDGILEHKINVTMYRGTVIEQMSDIITYYETPPNRWGYAWVRDASK